MPEQLLAILKICVLALLYLFFVRVLRVVWQESRLVSERSTVPAPAAAAVAAPAGPAPTASPIITSAQPVSSHTGPIPGTRPTHLSIIAPPKLAGRSAELGVDNTLGRSSSCTLPLDDTYISQVHARIYFQGDHCMVEDKGSTNGTYLDSRRLVAPAIAHIGSRLELGNIVMEFR